MLRVASVVIGNSSSGIVEVPSAGIPTVDTPAYASAAAMPRRPSSTAEKARTKSPMRYKGFISTHARHSRPTRESVFKSGHPEYHGRCRGTLCRFDTMSAEIILQHRHSRRPMKRCSSFRPAEAAKNTSKNIKTLGGRPLIAYSIDVARNIAGRHGTASYCPLNRRRRNCRLRTCARTARGLFAPRRSRQRHHRQPRSDYRCNGLGRYPRHRLRLHRTPATDIAVPHRRDVWPAFHGIIYLRFRHGGKCLRIIGKPILQPV